MCLYCLFLYFHYFFTSPLKRISQKFIIIPKQEAILIILNTFYIFTIAANLRVIKSCTGVCAVGEREWGGGNAPSAGSLSTHSYI